CVEETEFVVATESLPLCPPASPAPAVTPGVTAGRFNSTLGAMAMMTIRTTARTSLRSITRSGQRGRGAEGQQLPRRASSPTLTSHEDRIHTDSRTDSCLPQIHATQTRVVFLPLCPPAPPNPLPLQGSGSYPPSFHGWHFTNRFIPSQLPCTRPYFR